MEMSLIVVESYIPWYFKVFALLAIVYPVFVLVRVVQNRMRNQPLSLSLVHACLIPGIAGLIFTWTDFERALRVMALYDRVPLSPLAALAAEAHALTLVGSAAGVVIAVLVLLFSRRAEEPKKRLPIVSWVSLLILATLSLIAGWEIVNGRLVTKAADALVLSGLAATIIAAVAIAITGFMMRSVNVSSAAPAVVFLVHAVVMTASWRLMRVYEAIAMNPPR
jgi:hypothetical protein